MAENLKNKTVLVVDNGFFLCLAERLPEFFGRVMYFSPWISALPDIERADIGKGIEGVERVLSLYDHIDDVDLFVFPDLYYADYQEHLRKLGKRVWGNGRAEWMELDRWKMRQHMMKSKMPVPKTRPVKGLDKLKEILQKEKDLFVKPSMFRGVSETWHHEEWFLSEPIIEELEHKLGVRKSDVDFIVENNLGEAVEIGYDGYVVDGKYPSHSFFGYEVKDCGYIGRFAAQSELPRQIQYVNHRLAPVFAENKSRGFYSNEIRITPDGVPYLIDPTIRMPAPPGEIYIQAYENLGEILWEGAGGVLVNPEAKQSFGALAVIYSKTADEDWIAIKVEKEVRPFVKFKNHTVVDGKDYVVPLHLNLNEIGAVVGFGDSVEEAIEEVEKHAEGVKGYGLTVKTDSLKEAQSVIEQGEEAGIHFVEHATV